MVLHRCLSGCIGDDVFADNVGEMARAAHRITPSCFLFCDDDDAPRSLVAVPNWDSFLHPRVSCRKAPAFGEGLFPFAGPGHDGAVNGRRLAATSFFEFQEPCQHWVVSDNLHDIVHGISDMRVEATPWLLGSRSSPALQNVSDGIWKKLNNARLNLRDVYLELIDRHLRPTKYSRKEHLPNVDEIIMRDDPARFASYIPDDIVKRMQNSVHFLESALTAHKAEDFDSDVVKVDAAERRRESLALQNLVELGADALRAATRCNQPPHGANLENLDFKVPGKKFPFSL